MTQGHQLRFFAHPNDLPDLGSRLRALGALAVESRTDDAALRVGPVPELQPGSTTLLTTQRLTQYLRPRHMPTYDCWVVTAGSDSVLELSTSPFDGQVLRHGRLWWVADYSTGDEFVTKPQALTSFARTVDELLRDWLVREQGRMLSPEAAVALKAGAVQLRE